MGISSGGEPPVVQVMRALKESLLARDRDKMGEMARRWLELENVMESTISALAHEVDAGLRLAGLALEEACERALARVTALGSRGGLVAVDTAGRVAAPFTTRGMVRGWIGAEGAPRVSLFADE